MSILINAFDPSNNALLDARGIGTIVTNGVNPKEQLVLYNSSLVCFKLTFNDQTTDIIPPSWAKSFRKPGAIGIVQYQPLFILPAEPGAQPISTCYGSIYESDEFINDINVPLQYIYNIANSGGIPVSNNTLTNIGNAPNSNVITMQPNDTTSPTITIDNSGNISIYGDNAGVLTLLLKLIAGASPSVQLATAGITTFVFGPVQLSQTLAVQGSSNLDNGKIVSDGAGNVTVQSLTTIGNILVGAQIHVTGLSNFDNGAITTDGLGNITLVGGGINFSVGRIKEINNGTIVTASSVLVNHGLSGQPVAVVVTPTSAGSTATCAAYGYTSTQFTLLNGSGVSQMFRWIAYR